MSGRGSRLGGCGSDRFSTSDLTMPHSGAGAYLCASSEGALHRRVLVASSVRCKLDLSAAAALGCHTAGFFLRPDVRVSPTLEGGD